MPPIEVIISLNQLLAIIGVVVSILADFFYPIPDTRLLFLIHFAEKKNKTADC
jgi:hypothetical protein